MEIESLIPSGVGLGGTVVGLIGMWFKFQNKVENLEKERDDGDRRLLKDLDAMKEVNRLQWEKIDSLHSLQNSFEIESIENNNKIEIKIAELNGENRKFESMLFSIEKKLDSLILKLESK